MVKEALRLALARALSTFFSSGLSTCMAGLSPVGSFYAGSSVGFDGSSFSGGWGL